MGTNFDPGVRINDFKIIKCLGTGGMGIVYLARQVSLNRLVALKVLGPTIDDSKARARFRREYRAVALLKHPAIAEVYYAGQDEKLCYMATEFIDGLTLRQALKRIIAARNTTLTFDSLLQSPGQEEVDERVISFDLPPDEDSDLHEPADNVNENCHTVTPEAAQLITSKDYIQRLCTLARDTALALDYAHQHSVIHRDIKPENLMLDRKGIIHIIDFGVARFHDDVSLSQSGALVGTPMYMSPEHITGRINIDCRSDVFSLGIVLYEALTLQPPYSAWTREGIFRQIVNKAMPPVSWRNLGISGDMEAVVHKAIARDPEERYQTALEFAQDLQNVIDGKPTIARFYRYKLDLSETLAKRPIGVTLCAIHFFGLMCFIAFFHLAALADESLSLRATRTAIFYGGIVIAGIVISCGVGAVRTLIGLNSVKNLIAIQIVMGIIILYNYFLFMKGNFLQQSNIKIISFIFILIMYTIQFVLLMLPKTRAWIRETDALRSNFKRQVRARKRSARSRLNTHPK